MGSGIPYSLKQSVLGWICLIALVPSQLVAAGSTYRNHENRHHARITHSIQSRQQGTRHTKFSHYGPLGIRAYEKATAKIAGTYIGLIPDAGDTGGKAQTMQEIIKSLHGKRPACFGWYAQVPSSKTFDGSQLFEIMDDLKKCKCVFNPAIMPHSWNGFKYNNNYQAVAIAKVLRKFTDEDIPVILRFGHEVNWYQRTGECQGNAQDFKEGWHVVAQAVRKYCPDCLLHWSPNVSTMEEYHKYAPYDMDQYVDVVGIDFYPKSPPASGEFVKKVKQFHDTFAINGRKFALGEAGLHYAGSYEDRVNWLTQIASSKPELPNLVFVNWYNSVKEFDYKIAGDGESTALLTEKLE